MLWSQPRDERLQVLADLQQRVRHRHQVGIEPGRGTTLPDFGGYGEMVAGHRLLTLTLRHTSG